MKKSTPLIMSAPMMRAYLAGTKTETRRTRGLKKLNEYPGAIMPDPDIKSPWGGPGDELWFRETWGFHDGKIYYRADYNDRPDFFRLGWQNPMFMPRQYSRAQRVPVVSVHLERLHEITDAGAVAEGVSCRQEYINLWESMHGRDRLTRWARDPWVWVIRFEKCGG